MHVLLIREILEPFIQILDELGNFWEIFFIFTTFGHFFLNLC